MFTIFLAYLSLFFHTWPPWDSSSCVSPHQVCHLASGPCLLSCSCPLTRTHPWVCLWALGSREGTWQEARPGIQGIWQRNGRSREQGLRSSKVWAAKLWRMGNAGVQACVTASHSCSGRGCAHWGQLGAQALEVVHGCCCPRGARGCLWVAAQSHSRCSRCSWA